MEQHHNGDACALFGDKESLAQRIVSQLGSVQTMQTALRLHGNDPVNTVASFTRNEILNLCLEAGISIQQLTGPVQWASVENKAEWEKRAATHVHIVDTVSLGDAIAMTEVPMHPDVVGDFGKRLPPQYES